MQQPAEVFVDDAPVVRVGATPPPGTSDLLVPPLRALLGVLGARYRSEVDRLLAARADRQLRFNAGETPDFPAATRALREADWQVAPIPDELQDRRVEITGPVDRKMVINALNAGARVFMADFEDSTTPTWPNLMNGQRNLFDAVRRTIEYRAADGREYRLVDDPAILMVRPRGLHLDEAHLTVDGQALPGALFDAAVFLYHNAAELVARGSGPYLYLPKLESAAEAALWDSVLGDLERSLALQPGTIKVTVLIETITAAFEMEEILYALRTRVVALNCGRWDYIFSYIKRFRAHPDKVLPNREQVTMNAPFLRAYSQLLVQTCHRRGALAMGGMAAQIPNKYDAAANADAIDKVRADKEREARDGHDGTWVAHPGLVPVARGVFDRVLTGRNQVGQQRQDLVFGARELLEPARGTITESGVRGNLRVALRYLASWLSGQGCVPIDGLMEDAATAEIARAQLWQWVRHPGGRLPDGRDITLALVAQWQAQTIATMSDSHGLLARASAILTSAIRDDEFIEFITLPAYKEITRHGL